MKRTRKLSFIKVILDGSTADTYKTFSDSKFTSFVLEQTKKYDLKLKQLELCDFGVSCVKVKGDQDLFLEFVNKVVTEYGKYLRQVKF